MYFMDLHIFEEAAAPAEETSSRGKSNPLANVQYGKQAETDVDTAVNTPAAKQTETLVTTDTEDARRAEFERLIKEEYKDLYTERTQQMINTRFKQAKEAEEKQAALTPVLEMLSAKYGVDATDVKALSKAIQDDDSYYEDEAIEKGMSVEQLKEIKRLESENAAFKAAEQERERRAQSQQVYAQWETQAAQAKQVYPQFDLRNEVQDPETGDRFISLLRSGIDVRTAYEVIHKDDIIGGAMQYAVQTAQAKLASNVRARGMRPAENGAAGTSPAQLNTDPSKWTKRDREEISRRVLRSGARIEL